MSAALDIASINGSAVAAAGLAALAASLLPPGRPARKGSYSGLQRRPGAQSQPQRCRAAPGVSAGSEMRGKEEKSSLKGGFTALPAGRPALAGKLLPTGEITPPAAGPPRSGAPERTEGCMRGPAGAAFGTEGGQVTWQEQRSPCKKTDAKRGRGRWCNRPERGQRRATEGPRSGCAVGTCGQRGGPRRSGEEGSGLQPLAGCAEERGRLCRSLPGSWEMLASAHSWHECGGEAEPPARLRGATSLRLEGDARGAASRGRELRLPSKLRVSSGF